MNVIDPTAYIHEKVKYGDNNYFMTYCVIGSQAVTYEKYKLLLPKYGITIGNNCYFHTHSIVCLGMERDTLINNNVIVGQGTIIGHDIILNNNVRIMNGCMLSGYSEIGSDTYIGIGACIRNRVKIGENTIIGMGSVVTKDIPSNVIAYGNPCKVIRKNENDIKFNLRRMKTRFDNII